jgi:hypothetical protein
MKEAFAKPIHDKLDTIPLIDQITTLRSVTIRSDITKSNLEFLRDSIISALNELK